MSVAEAVRMAVQGVLVNRMRSVLTLLGVTIGVAAVILLVAVGHGSAAAVQSQIEGLGTNMLTIQAGGRTFGRQASTSSSFTFLTMKDVATLENKVNAPDIKAVVPVVSARGGHLVRPTACMPCRSCSILRTAAASIPPTSISPRRSR